jgi:hypothetical protein
MRPASGVDVHKNSLVIAQGRILVRPPAEWVYDLH